MRNAQRLPKMISDMPSWYPNSMLSEEALLHQTLDDDSRENRLRFHQLRMLQRLESEYNTPHWLSNADYKKSMGKGPRDRPPHWYP